MELNQEQIFRVYTSFVEQSGNIKKCYAILRRQNDFKDITMQVIDLLVSNKDFTKFVDKYAAVQSYILKLSVYEETNKILKVLVKNIEDNGIQDNISIFSKLVSYVNNAERSSRAVEIDPDTVKRLNSLKLRLDT
jgi:hypothetical protein